MWSELEKNIYSIFNNFNEIIKRSYTPQTKEELKTIINNCLQKHGNNCNLNNDISKWNVSNVENISSMFNNSKFKGDISNWNCSHVYYAYNPFNNCFINKKPKIYESNI